MVCFLSCCLVLQCFSCLLLGFATFLVVVDRFCYAFLTFCYACFVFLVSAMFGYFVLSFC